MDGWVEGGSAEVTGGGLAVGVGVVGSVDITTAATFETNTKPASAFKSRTAHTPAIIDPSGTAITKSGLGR